MGGAEARHRGVGRVRPYGLVREGAGVRRRAHRRIAEHAAQPSAAHRARKRGRSDAEKRGNQPLDALVVRTATRCWMLFGAEPGVTVTCCVKLTS